jgi:hypothetical protein
LGVGCFRKLQDCHKVVIKLSHNNRIPNRESIVMASAVLMVVGFSFFIAATWMYGQKEDQA